MDAQWTLELPVRHGARVDVFDLRIREDATAHSAEEHESRWTMVLGFDLPGLGPTYARVSLHGDQVATTFWAEDLDTVALIAAQLPELRAGYVADGLAVAQLQCFPGQPPSAKSAPSGVLSVHA